MYKNFKHEHLFDDRWRESRRIIEKYHDRIPTICERSKLAGRNCPIIDKNKYLVPNDFTLGQFIFVIRKRMKLPPEKAIFIFVNGNIPHSSERMIEIYSRHKDGDGFLYLSYTLESVFG